MVSKKKKVLKPKRGRAKETERDPGFVDPAFDDGSEEVIWRIREKFQTPD